jgi:riboflavin biosynthesis pyrimidine reductase
MPDPMLVDRLWPDPSPQRPLDELLADYAPPSAPGRPSVRINMVTSIDGRAQLDDTAEGLGSRVDRRLMRLYRAAHDAVATGSGTVRASGVWLRVPPDLAAQRAAAGRPAQPLSVVIAGSTPVDPARWHGEDEARVLVIGADNPQQPLPGVELLRAPTPVPDPAWILERLAERGVTSVLLEGGPTTNAAFLAAGLLDEVCWTLGATLVASDALPMISAIEGGSPYADDPRRGSLASVLRNGDELFLRYRFG